MCLGLLERKLNKVLESVDTEREDEGEKNQRNGGSNIQNKNN